MAEEKKSPSNDEMATKAASTDDPSPHKVSLESSVLKPPPELTKHWAKNHRTLIASSASSLLSTVVGQPFDTIKTQMQYKKFNNPMACAKVLWREEQYKAFFRGALAPLLSITLNRTLTFAVYQKAKYRYSDAIGRLTGGDEPLAIVNRPGSLPTFATAACFGAAGFTAGMLASFISTPFELIKSIAQLSGAKETATNTSIDDPLQRQRRRQYDNKGTIKTAQQIVADRGFFGLYSGFRLCFMKETIGSAIYFSTYESLKQLLVKYSKSDSPTSPGAVAMAGGTCGIVAWVSTYALDTARVNYQQVVLGKKRGEAVKMPVLGWFTKERYKGLSVSMARTCIVNAVFFSCFEFLKKQVNAIPDYLGNSVE